MPTPVAQLSAKISNPQPFVSRIGSRQSLRKVAQSSRYLNLSLAICTLLVCTGCATGRIPHHPPGKATPSLSINTYTGVFLLGPLRIVDSGARIRWAKPSTRRHLSFIPVTKGRAGDWSWRVLMDRSLIPEYRRLTDQSVLNRWSIFFGALHNFFKQMFGPRLPRIHYSIRLIPVRINDSRQCLTPSFHTINLCYEFPYPGKHTKISRASLSSLQVILMISAYLSHETTLALEQDRSEGNWPFSQDKGYGWGVRGEAQATLVSRYFPALYIARSDTHLVSVLLPPLERGVHLGQLGRVGYKYDLGYNIAGLAYERYLGSWRAICLGDTGERRQYQRFLYRALHDPAMLEKFRQKALEILQKPPYPRNVMLPVQTAEGQRRVTLSALNPGTHGKNTQSTFIAPKNSKKGSILSMLCYSSKRAHEGFVNK